MKFINRLCVLLCLCLIASSVNSFAQTRSRIVQTSESQPVNTPQLTAQVKRTVLSSPTVNTNQRPALTNNIVVVGQTRNALPQIKTTSSVQPTNSLLNTANPLLYYTSNFNDRLLSSINSKIGIPYLYGSMGPNRYDCSSFVWKVFQEAGLPFTRTSARTFWNEFAPVYGDDRFKFGTLVFFNKLGHVGIVADENGFYQASSSKGITYSKFAGYWEKRIVGYRRVPADYNLR